MTAKSAIGPKGLKVLVPSQYIRCTALSGNASLMVDVSKGRVVYVQSVHV